MEPMINALETDILDEVHLSKGVIANRNTIYLIGYLDDDLDEDDEPGYYDDYERKKRPVYKYQRDAEPDKRLQLVTTLEGFDDDIRIEMSYHPKEECVIYDGDGNQVSIENMKVTKENEKSKYALLEARCIDGKMYIASSQREVSVCNENGELHYLSTNMYEPHELERDGERETMKIVGSNGFRDIDGFDANHLYAVGGKGDVWRCIDGKWTRCGFPSNLPLYAVCCGEDGLVYITISREGITFVGKEDSWTQLESPNLSLGFENLVWHDGKVWATNDYGIWWITPEGITKAEVPAGVSCCAGRLHANAGMLLVVGINGAALHVDGEWELLVQ